MTKKTILMMSIAALILVMGIITGCKSDTVNEKADEQQISELIDKYVKTINDDDLALVGEIWSHEDYVSFIGPMGRYAGYEAIRDDFVHGIFGINFKTRNLQKEELIIHVNGESAWAEFSWKFEATRNDGGSYSSLGRETQLFNKGEDGWKLVHVHYSGR